jgi:hypothetical protein
MKNISRLSMLAVLGMAVITTNPAFARGDLEQQRRAAADMAYWQGKNRQDDRVTRINATESAAQVNANVSQYPCHRCTYDSARGGYVRAASPKN